MQTLRKRWRSVPWSRYLRA